MPQRSLHTTQLRYPMISCRQVWTTLLLSTCIPVVSHVMVILLTRPAEIQQAARMLFDSALDHMSEEELQNIIEKHQSYREYTMSLLRAVAHRQYLLAKRAMRKLVTPS
jgi:hypothetical protein